MLCPTRPLLAVSLFLMASISPCAARTRTPQSPHPDKKLLGIAAAVVVDGQVCDAAELKVPGGPATVIAIIDYSGRRFCNTVLRIRHGRPRS